MDDEAESSQSTTSSSYSRTDDESASIKPLTCYDLACPMKSACGGFLIFKGIEIEDGRKPKITNVQCSNRNKSENPCTVTPMISTFETNCLKCSSKMRKVIELYIIFMKNTLNLL